MHNSVRMTISPPTNFLQREMVFMFPYSLSRTTDEVDHPWCLSYHGEFLGIFSSNVSISPYAQRSPTRE